MNKRKKVKKNKISSSKSKNSQKQKPKQKQKQQTTKLSMYQRWRARAVEKIEERLEKETKKRILLKFFAAPIVVLIGLGVLFIIVDFGVFTQLGGLMLAYFLPPLGKESVIPIGVGAGLHPLLIGLSIAFVDIFIALFLLWNYDFAKLMPLLGPWMERVEKRGGKRFQERPWLEHLAFFGLILFVMFPFQGSGGVATSIIGRVIGMNKYKVFVAIILGAVIGCLFIAYFSDYIIGYFINDIYDTLITLIIIAIILGIYNAFKFSRKDQSEIKS